MTLKTHYIDEPTRSIITLSPPPIGLIEEGKATQELTAWSVDRVSVLPAHRGKGCAGRLLDIVCLAADLEQVPLFLAVVPSGPLGVDDLIAFYGRRGFVSRSRNPRLMRREPTPLNDIVLPIDRLRSRA